MILAATLALGLGPDRSVAPWVDANHKSIARIQSAKERRAREHLFERTFAELMALRDAPGPRRSGADAQSDARAILSNHRVYHFAAPQKPAIKTWWERLNEWIADRLSAIMGAIFKNVRLSGGISVALGDVLLGGAILAFLYLALRLALRYGGRGTFAIPAEELDPGSTPAALFAQAEEAAQSGRYSQAVTKVFAAAVRLLARRGLALGHPSETVGELRRRVRRSEFDILARGVTLAVYADAAVRAEDWQRARDAYKALAYAGAGDDAA